MIACRLLYHIKAFSALTNVCREKIQSILCYNDPMSKAENDEKAMRGREAAAKKHEAKEIAFEKEKHNDRYLIAFFSGIGWHKFGGRSALYYTHMIAPRLGIKAAIKPDNDFYFKFIDGVVSIRNLELLKTSLKKLKIKVAEENELYTIFDLGYKVEKQELKAIREVREERINQVNQIVKTKNLYPSLVSLARKIAHELYVRTNHSTVVGREVIMNKLSALAMKNVVDLQMMSNGYEPIKKTMENVLIANERIKSYLMLIMELAIIDPDHVLKLEMDLADMNNQIRAELKKL